MVDDSQHAARLQRRIEGFQRRLRLAALQPVVQVAEGEHEIGAARRGDGMAVGGEDAGLDPAEIGGIGGDLGGKARVSALGLVRGRLGIGGDVAALRLQIGRRESRSSNPTRRGRSRPRRCPA